MTDKDSARPDGDNTATIHLSTTLSKVSWSHNHHTERETPKPHEHARGKFAFFWKWFSCLQTESG